MPSSEAKEKKLARYDLENKSHQMTTWGFIEENGQYLTTLYHAHCRDCGMQAYISCSIPGFGRFADDNGGERAGPAFLFYCPANDPKGSEINPHVKERSDVQQQEFNARCFRASGIQKLAQH
jgi:hypothetical protein